MIPSLANTYIITVLFCVVTTRGEGYIDKRLLLHAETDLVQLVQTMKTEIDTLSSTVRSMSDTLHSLTNTVYNLTTTNQAQEEKIKAGSYNLPAFMAVLSGDLLHCSANQHVVFDNVILNVGDVYNSLHGVFRAPVSGTYQFSLTLSEPNNGGRYQVVIKKGKSATVIGYLYTDPSTLWVLRSTSVLTQLEVGEDVWVSCIWDENHIGGSTDNTGKYQSHFSGFLVSH